MDGTISRRDLLKTVTAGCLASMTPPVAARTRKVGIVSGRMTGAAALVETLQQEGTSCIFGIPGAQYNELWDTMKSKGLPHVLVTHEFSASTMADGYARATGRPGVICIIPGPGITNALSGIGEALLDSVPLVCLVGDVGRGDKYYHAFQCHDLPASQLMKPVTKAVFEIQSAAEIADTVRKAFLIAQEGEPGPVAVVIPYNYLLAESQYHSPALPPPALPCDETAVQQAVAMLADRRQRVGIYAGMGCMEYTPALAQAAEILQAPVATSVSGKGVIPWNHPLSVGWGYGPHGTRTAEEIFKSVDIVLAIGVKYSEVSTGFYSIPKHRCVIHVDINPNNLGRNVENAFCVHCDAGVFLSRIIAGRDALCRPTDGKLLNCIAQWKYNEAQKNAVPYAQCGTDPMAFVLALRRCTRPDALVYVDVTLTEHWSAEAFAVYQPRTYFNPTDNQGMGWSIPASIGGQRAWPGRQVVTITGDGCFLMSAMEISTAAREGLPVKFFVLDDQAYHYMQAVQRPAYHRTTATILARLDYAALAKGFGVAYNECLRTEDLDGVLQGALDYPGPVLTRIFADYRNRPVRFIDAARRRYTREMPMEQKARFAARIGSRILDLAPDND
jgi:acetolactate synthase-1/2/3 large subunit